MACIIPGGILVSEKDIGQSFVRIYDGDVLVRDFELRKSPDGRWFTHERIKNKSLEFDNMIQVEVGQGSTILYEKKAYEDKLRNGSMMYIDTGYNPTMYIDTGYNPMQKYEVYQEQQ